MTSGYLTGFGLRLESSVPLPMIRRNPMPIFRSICFLVATLAPAHADVAVLEAWLVRQRSIRSLEVAFVQERRLPALKHPVSTPGKLSFEKPNRIRWQLGEPVQTLAVSDGTTLTLVEDAGKSVRHVPADSPRAARFSTLTGNSFGNAEAFHEAFAVVESRVSLGIHQFTLQPKDRRTRAEVPWVFLDIDPVRTELRALEMELRDKSRIRTVFGEARFNLEFPAAHFQP
jgi:outer membrane lipoprotein carrier protein